MKVIGSIRCYRYGFGRTEVIEMRMGGGKVRSMMSLAGYFVLPCTATPVAASLAPPRHDHLIGLV